ncbi:hypothetical protein VTJ83DRAFT_4488 [Remersonia thermophila]|uniref:Cytochrome b5 heme-binding domain-containing protein n=1 Tax=Remersonia thermophila TaxID=72144 RepID=A0ABR4DA40_9PEZI
MLFGSEKAQLLANGGLPTWEFAPLAEFLANDWPGGHRANDRVVTLEEEKASLVRVDEDKWHPVWKRQKWYDFAVKIVDGEHIPKPVPGVGPEDVWSVDNRRLWEELRVCIELADRKLRLLAEHNFLYNIVHSVIEEWADAELTDQAADNPDYDLVSPSGKPYRLPAKPKACSAEATLNIIADQVAPRLVWSFFDDDYFQDQTYIAESELFGFTRPVWHNGEGPGHTPDAITFLITHLHVAPLRVLLRDDSTAAERCHARFSFASTMVHELMHSIWIWRGGFEDNKEPIYGEGWLAELGHAGISEFFGGHDLAEVPKLAGYDKPGYKYGLSATQWPSPPSGTIERIKGKAINYLGASWENMAIPSAWFSALQMEDFWAKTVNKYGLEAVKAPRFFRSEVGWWGFYLDAGHADLVLDSETVIRAQVLPQIWKSLDAIQARREEWKRLRPWTDREYKLWSESPYANVIGRRLVDDFSKWADPSWRYEEYWALIAEHKAADIADNLARWTFDNVKRDEDEPVPPQNRIFGVFAFMMLATLPRREDGENANVQSRVMNNVWFPSKAAQAGDGAMWELPPRWHWGQMFPPYFQIEPRDFAKEPLPTPYGYGNPPQPSSTSKRLAYLERALDLFQDIERSLWLPHLLHDAVDKELKSLFNQAAWVKQDDEWLDWSFEWPQYRASFSLRGPDQLLHTRAQGQPPSAAPSGFLAHVEARPVQVADVLDRNGNPLLAHFTIAQIADVNAANNYRNVCWVVVPNPKRNKDVFIYNIAQVFRDKPELDPQEVLYWTKYGKGIFKDRLLAWVKENLQPCGKLAFGYSQEEVCENDGTQAKPWWIVIGVWIYDITNYNYCNDEEQWAILLVVDAYKKSGPLNPVGDVHPWLLQRLEPYRCGFYIPDWFETPGIPENVPRAPLPPTPEWKDSVFTQRDVERYIYPPTGMYCIIDNEVWDLGRYMHQHPGGYHVLRRHAGTDVTALMEELHGPNIQDHLDAWRPWLRLGRVVEERTYDDPIDNDEIVLFDIVYKIPSVKELMYVFPGIGSSSIAESLEHNLKRLFGGTDASQEIHGPEGTPECLRVLLENNKFARAVRRPPRMSRRRITSQELAKHTYAPQRKEWLEPRWVLPPSPEAPASPTDEEHGFAGWVAVEEAEGGKAMVYNVTPMVRFDDNDNLVNVLRQSLGNLVTDPEVAGFLRTRRRAFIVGELTDDPNVEPQDIISTYSPVKVSEAN